MPAAPRPRTKKPPAAAPRGKTAAAKRFPIFSFERVTRLFASRRLLFRRLGTAIAVWFAIMFFGLAIGIAGYAGFEGMGLVDAYLNAAMILSGMGPVSELKTEAGKIFAGSYAIFSGLVIVLATGVVLSPIVHHVLHVFHADMDDDGKPDGEA